MLFPFTIGIHSALAKTRGEGINGLVQEAAVGSILSHAKLGKAMYDNPKAMKQAFKLYGSNSKTIKKLIPHAFGLVKK